MDVALVPVAIVCAFALRYGMPNPAPVVLNEIPLLLLVTVLSGGIINAMGLPRIKLQSLEVQAVARIALTAAILAVSAIVASYLIASGEPRSVPLIFGAVFFGMSLGTRLIAITLLEKLRERGTTRLPVAIYGAGSAGVQLAAALRSSREARAVVFVDDNPSYDGLMVAGLPVKSPNVLRGMADQGRIKRVLLALPSVTSTRKNEILRRLSDLPCEVQMLPSHGELLERGSIEENLRTVTPDELLGRNKVDLNVPDVAKAYAGRCVLVTGAGGSIGSELCRQLLDCQPRKIILYDHSEFALYSVERDLRKLLVGKNIALRAQLGSVTDKDGATRVLRENNVEIVLHAAAYKHVPLVEDNEVAGARNNVLGTHCMAEAACEAGVERFILVSTDKAVRPTNIMGATKRLAELVIQDIQTRRPKTKLAMVRFGNVLGSSGSVLPLFQSQIEIGGPVTVTHSDVTRFFMTIPEAARLVLLAGAYAEGGDVFVLDMGKPIRIIDMARRMIELSGQRVKEDGDIGGIAIEVTGLRPGEKLYEELLIDDESLRATPHEKILRAHEDYLSEIETAAMFRDLREAVTTGDKERVRRNVAKYVIGYHQQGVASA
ncbi:polysaccharide biosynthesis protein [Octadecabacter sp. R77987]|uniref:polysaccharide biosynthesis protein n=1 Tax=Octadecabacter sp. R77987 TaxID=3093874 RepID=UPI003670F321